MDGISLGEIIARGNREGAKAFIAQYGIRPTNNESSLAMSINRILLTGGDQALSQLMKIHPDREAIISTVEPKEDEFSNATGYERMQQRDRKDKFSNCCGHSNMSGNNYHNCSGCAGSCGGTNKMSNADGNGSSAQAHVDIMGKQMFYTIIGVAIIFGFIALTRTDKQRG